MTYYYYYDSQHSAKKLTTNLAIKLTILYRTWWQTIYIYLFSHQLSP